MRLFVARRAGRYLAGLVAAASFSLAACVGQMPVNASVGYADTERAAAVRTYRVEFDGMPEFLKPMLRDEASRVLAEHGLDYTEGDAHAVLLMSFVNRPLQSDIVTTGDESGETPHSEIIAARFDARVELELRDSVSEERIWSGGLSRVHYVTEGAYMHEEPARTAMRDALRMVFEDFPNRLQRTWTPE